MTTYIDLFSRHTNKLHFLGLCGVNYLMYMIYLAYKKGVIVTSDWSFANNGFPRYVIPLTLKTTTTPKEITCECPICKYLESKGVTHRDNARYVFLHDIYWTDMLIRNWRAVAKYDIDTYVNVYVKLYAKRMYDYLKNSKTKVRRGLDEW